MLKEELKKDEIISRKNRQKLKKYNFYLRKYDKSDKS